MTDPTFSLDSTSAETGSEGFEGLGCACEQSPT
jgi:hypothetical protein